MAEVKWLKIVTDIFDDEKIVLIDSLPERDTILVMWFKVLCLAGKQNNGGVLMLNDRIAYTDEMLSTIFRRPIASVRLALSTFEQFGMIEIVEGAITIPNWDKHQNIEKLDKIKEQTKNRVARYREKQKLIANPCQYEDETQCNANVTRYSNATVTQCNATDKIREDKIREDKSISVASQQTKKRFSHPSVDEVDAYIKEHGYSVDAQRFVDYYKSNGWKVGRNKMEDWEAAVRTWQSKESPKQKKTANKTEGGFDVDRYQELLENRKL